MPTLNSNYWSLSSSDTTSISGGFSGVSVTNAASDFLGSNATFVSYQQTVPFFQKVTFFDVQTVNAAIGYSNAPNVLHSPISSLTVKMQNVQNGSIDLSRDQVFTTTTVSTAADAFEPGAAFNIFNVTLSAGRVTSSPETGGGKFIIQGGSAGTDQNGALVIDGSTSIFNIKDAQNGQGDGFGGTTPPLWNGGQEIDINNAATCNISLDGGSVGTQYILTNGNFTTPPLMSFLQAGPTGAAVTALGGDYIKIANSANGPVINAHTNVTISENTQIGYGSGLTDIAGFGSAGNWISGMTLTINDTVTGIFGVILTNSDNVSVNSTYLSLAGPGNTGGVLLEGLPFQTVGAHMTNQGNGTFVIR